jgi:hypothetical protein
VHDIGSRAERSSAAVDGAAYSSGRRGARCGVSARECRSCDGICAFKCGHEGVLEQSGSECGEAVEARGERTRKKEKGEGRSAKNHINCNNSRFCKCPTQIPSAAVS